MSPSEVEAGQLMAEVSALVSSAARVYGATAEALGEDFNPLTPEVSTTEAVMLATALLKARDLNPFDLAVWFSRTPATPSAGQPTEGKR